MNFIGFEHHSGIGGPPENFLPFTEPREDPLCIGNQQSFGSEVSSVSEQTVGLG